MDSHTCRHPVRLLEEYQALLEESLGVPHLLTAPDPVKLVWALRLPGLLSVLYYPLRRRPSEVARAGRAVRPPPP